MLNKRREISKDSLTPNLFYVVSIKTIPLHTIRRRAMWYETVQEDMLLMNHLKYQEL